MPKANANTRRSIGAITAEARKLRATDHNNAFAWGRLLIEPVRMSRADADWMRKRKRKRTASLAAATRKANAAIAEYKLADKQTEPELRRAAIDAIKSRHFMDNSHERLPTILKLAGPAPPAIWWPVFLEGWVHCDATWYHQDLLLMVLRHKSPARPFLPPGQQALLDNLPDQVQVFRGCSHDRVRGVSWTTSRKVAEGFARGHRSIKVPDPVVVTATINKNAVFLVNWERSEDEVILDPEHLQNLVVESWVSPEK
jgi:hypothetical protein